MVPVQGRASLCIAPMVDILSLVLADVTGLFPIDKRSSSIDRQSNATDRRSS